MRHLLLAACATVALVACSSDADDGDDVMGPDPFIVTASDHASSVYRGQEEVLSINGRITSIVRTGDEQAVLETDRGGQHTINVLEGPELRQLDEGSDLVAGPGRLAYRPPGTTDAVVLDASTLKAIATVPLGDSTADLLAVRDATVFVQTTVEGEPAITTISAAAVGGPPIEVLEGPWRVVGLSPDVTKVVVHRGGETLLPPYLGVGPLDGTALTEVALTESDMVQGVVWSEDDPLFWRAGVDGDGAIVTTWAPIETSAGGAAVGSYSEVGSAAMFQILTGQSTDGGPGLAGLVAAVEGAGATPGVAPLAEVEILRCGAATQGPPACEAERWEPTVARPIDFIEQEVLVA